MYLLHSNASNMSTITLFYSRNIFNVILIQMYSEIGLSDMNA